MGRRCPRPRSFSERLSEPRGSSAGIQLLQPGDFSQELAHSFPSNVAYDSVILISNPLQVGDWERLFPAWERIMVIYVGATAMYFVGKRLRRKYNLKENVRHSFYDEVNTWLRSLQGKKFSGGEKPSLADLVCCCREISAPSSERWSWVLQAMVNIRWNSTAVISDKKFSHPRRYSEFWIQSRGVRLSKTFCRTRRSKDGTTTWRRPQGESRRGEIENSPPLGPCTLKRLL